VLPFWLSIAVLSLVQGVLVLLPAARPFAILERLRSPAWALVPAASVAAVVAAITAAGDTARVLTYAALAGVPVLAALALGRAARGGSRRLVLLAPALFVLAWAARSSLAGEAAALVLTALSCVTLGALLAAVAPPRWLAAGIVAMAVVDAVLVAADLLQAPNHALNAAAPGAGLPQLQSVLFGRAQMGYGDLFVACALGALLAADASTQRRAAALTAVFALAFDLLFFVIPELPATVPVALTLIALELAGRRRRGRAAAPRPAPAQARTGVSLSGSGWRGRGRRARGA
jgi:hypothetical protein